MLKKKKEFWWLIADFEIKEGLKHVKQLKNILTKHANMAYINWEQDHYKIKHILTKIHAMNNSTCQLKEKNHKNENTYLHEHTHQWKNILEIKEIFTSLRSKIIYLQKRNS